MWISEINFFFFQLCRILRKYFYFSHFGKRECRLNFSVNRVLQFIRFLIASFVTLHQYSVNKLSVGRVEYFIFMKNKCTYSVVRKSKIVILYEVKCEKNAKKTVQPALQIRLRPQVLACPIFSFQNHHYSYSYSYSYSRKKLYYTLDLCFFFKMLYCSPEYSRKKCQNVTQKIEVRSSMAVFFHF